MSASSCAILLSIREHALTATDANSRMTSLVRDLPALARRVIARSFLSVATC